MKSTTKGLLSSIATTALALAAFNSVLAGETVWLDTLDLSKMRQGYGTPQANRAIRETPLTLSGRTFARGVGTHAHSTLWVHLNGGTERFSATVGVDDAAAGPGSVSFRVLADGKKVYDSGVMKTGTPPKSVSVDLQNVKMLLLQVTDALQLRTQPIGIKWLRSTL